MAARQLTCQSATFVQDAPPLPARSDSSGIALRSGHVLARLMISHQPVSVAQCQRLRIAPEQVEVNALYGLAS